MHCFTQYMSFNAYFFTQKIRNEASRVIAPIWARRFKGFMRTFVSGRAKLGVKKAQKLNKKSRESRVSSRLCTRLCERTFRFHVDFMQLNSACRILNLITYHYFLLQHLATFHLSLTQLFHLLLLLAYLRLVPIHLYQHDK